MADKNFYGMALQLERKYDRLVLQKNKIKKEVPKGLLTYLDALHRVHAYSKNKLRYSLLYIGRSVDGTM